MYIIATFDMIVVNQSEVADMKLRNNLSEEAFANSYRAQGYDEYQIRELILMLEKHSGLEKLMTVDTSSAHMAMLNMFSDMGCLVQAEFFFEDGTLDVKKLEYEFKQFELLRY